MHRGRSLDVIVSAAIVHAPWPSVVQPERYAVFSLVAETIDAFSEPDLEMPEVYDLLTGVIAAIATSAAPSSLVPRFSLRLLDLLGLAPPLDRCVACGTAMGGEAIWLDAQAGGFIDERCRARWRDLPQLDAADLDNLRRLASAKGSKAAAVAATPAASKAIEELVAHHLGRRPKATAHLAGLGA
jgi:recombinational DNA repair protein (RecF pathway)